MLRVYHASVLPLLGRKGGENLSSYRQEKLEKINNPRVYAQSLGAELLLMAALRDMGLPAEPLAISSGKARNCRRPGIQSLPFRGAGALRPV